MSELLAEDYNPEQEVEVGNYKVCDLKPQAEQK